MSTLELPPAATPHRRRVWPWVLAVLLSPFVILGVAALSYLTLDRPASILRRQVADATGATWHTQFQLSAGRLTLGAVEAGLCFVPGENTEKAVLALDAVKSASIGVYETSESTDGWSHAEIIKRADAAMTKRGWVRVVGVAEPKQSVLIYAPAEPAWTGNLDVCMAVLDGKQLVVVSATVSPDSLGRLVARVTPAEFKRHFHVAVN